MTGPEAVRGMLLRTFMEVPGAETVPTDLTVGPAGLTIDRRDGHPWLVPWGAVADARCGEPGFTPDGTPAVAITATVQGRFVRWVVPGMSPERATALNMLLEMRQGAPSAPAGPTAPAVPPQPPAVPTGPAVAPPPPPPPPSVPTAPPVPIAPAVAPPPAVPTGPAVAPPPAVPTAPAVPPPPAVPIVPAVPPPPAGPTTPAEPTGPTVPAVPPPLVPAPAGQVPPPRQWSVIPVPGVTAPATDPAAGTAPATGVDPAALGGPPPAPEAVVPAARDRRPGGFAPMAPIGGWGRPVESEAERRMRRTVRILVILVLVVVVVGLVVLAVGLSLPAHKNPHGASRSPQDASLARSVRITAADLPAGWTSNSTGTGPLSGLLPDGQGTGLAPGTHVARATAVRFASCMRSSAGSDVIVGRAGASPSDRSVSPVFTSTAGNAAMGVASVTSVYRSEDEVQMAATEMAQPAFPRCLGSVVGAELLKSAAAVPSDAGASFGTLSVSPMSLPQRASVRVAGVDLSVPVTATGVSTTVDVGFVLVAGGRVEATLVSYAAGGPFPESLSRSLAADLERLVAATVGR